MRPGSYFLNTARETLVDERGAGRRARVGPPGRRGPRRRRAPGGARAAPAAAPRRTWSLTPHIGGATHETLLPRCRDDRRRDRPLRGRRAARERRRPRPALRADERRATCSRSTRAPAAAGPCSSTPTAARSRSASASTSHAATPGVPGSQVFDTAAQLGADLRVRRARRSRGRGRRAGGPAVSATSMREGMVLYDAGGREIWACPNVDSPRRDARPRSSSSRARRRRSTSAPATGSRSPRRPGCAGSRRHQPDVFAAVPTSGCSATGS